MSAFFLNEAIEAMRQHGRPGVTRHGHYRLTPARWLPALRKLFAARRAA
jgi:hypothetical protein